MTSNAVPSRSLPNLCDPVVHIMIGGGSSHSSKSGVVREWRLRPGSRVMHPGAQDSTDGLRTDTQNRSEEEGMLRENT